jgi:hypothetical protein
MKTLALLALLILASCAGQGGDDAKQVALSSTCMEYGNLTGESMYNDYTDTWWFEIDAVKEGCAPACVVYENRTAEVNWRCTGLLPG